VEVDYQTGRWTPKDALIIWDDPTSSILVDARKNLIGNQIDDAPFCSIVVQGKL
jgi:hypothetical protein